ncbi:hypothetical protein FHU38_002578 [Saccharomonospora amisosensis]|uniref:Flagellar basal body-associated protein FliL n=1 Tax=Saccharomonospora amisosensis TaxID=1128677 RepID=A0A7X5ZQV1_9PSEU|nr:flagellar basal body protein FliL [Saccharomonospora amisosensis]NIJ12234.1 hypothetical protein [Saccharomonospora amisosensis]
MTSPGQGDQWPQQYPQQNQQQWPQQNPQQYPQQPFPQPQQQDQPGGYQQYPPTAPQQPYQGQYGHTAQYTQPAGYPAPPGQGKSRRGLVITLVVLLVLAVGGGATWFALSRGESVAAGATSPNEAATNLANALGSRDLVGVLSTLAPAEASLLVDATRQSAEEYQRLGVLTQDLDLENFQGIEIKTENLRFAEPERINDHLAITKLTGGKITVDIDPGRMPIAQEFLDALTAQSGAGLSREPEHHTLDIAQLVREAGEPLRIATVQDDGGWYPSLLYTVADLGLLANGESWPQESIPHRGADSANAAVQQLVQAALDADLNRMIELLPPDEMAVLHDVGPVLVSSAADEAEPTGVEVTQLRTETSDVDGGTRTTITSVELRAPGEGTASVTKNGGCYQLESPGFREELCGDQVGAMIAAEADGPMPPALQEALTNLMGGVFEQGLGVVTTEVDGKHYVSPLRTFQELGMSFLRSMQPQDLKAMIEAGN